MIKIRFFQLITIIGLLLNPAQTGLVHAAEPTPSGLKKIVQIADSADSAFVLNPGAPEVLILIGSDAEKKLTLYRLTNQQIEKVATGDALGHVWGATLYGTGANAKVIVAYGLGRGDLTPPLRVVSYPITLGSPTAVRTFQTERAQVNSFKMIGEKILITHFISKYESETGFISLKASGDWDYEKTIAIRMGTSSDAIGNTTIIGRMYGDSQTQDGDLLLKEGTEPARTLPSYRGVSSVAFLPGSSKTDPQIAIGDGWHSNYGQVAQARFSILSKIPGTGRYSLDFVHLFKNAYAVNKVFPLDKNSSNQLLLVTDKELWIGHSARSWRFDSLYQQTNTSTVFNVDWIKGDKSGASVLVSDGAVSVYRVDL